MRKLNVYRALLESEFCAVQDKGITIETLLNTFLKKIDKFSMTLQDSNLVDLILGDFYLRRNYNLDSKK